jgi:hypothetical protein
VLPNLNVGLTLKDLATLLKSTPEKIRRSIIYLAANNLIKNVDLPIELPSTHNPEIVDAMITLLGAGLPYKRIQKKLNLPYNIFLYYLFFPSVYIELEGRKVYTAQQLNTHNGIRIDLTSCIEYFLSNNKPITIENICTHLGVYHETLRQHGFLPLIKMAKTLQNESLKSSSSPHIS